MAPLPWMGCLAWPAPPQGLPALGKYYSLAPQPWRSFPLRFLGLGGTFLMSPGGVISKEAYPLSGLSALTAIQVSSHCSGPCADSLVGDVPSDVFQLRLILVVWERECVWGGCFGSDLWVCPGLSFSGLTH